MNTELFDRIRREIAISVQGAQETVFAIADRVNRKTQAVKLHWHAADLSRHISLAYQQAGAIVIDCLLARDRNPGHADTEEASRVQGQLEQIAATIRLLRQELARIDRRIAEIEAETLSEDLMRFQLDLTSRSLSIERLTVASEAPAVGLSMEQMSLSPGTRVIAVFRGPALLLNEATNTLRPDDIVFLLGQRADLQQDRLQFTHRQRATA